MYRGECVQERLNQELREVFNKLSASEEKQGTLVAQLEETVKKLQHAEEEKQTLQVLHNDCTILCAVGDLQLVLQFSKTA